METGSCGRSPQAGKRASGGTGIRCVPINPVKRGLKEREAGETLCLESVSADLEGVLALIASTATKEG
jgi:hypothetical protein